MKFRVLALVLLMATLATSLSAQRKKRVKNIQRMGTDSIMVGLTGGNNFIVPLADIPLSKFLNDLGGGGSDDQNMGTPVLSGAGVLTIPIESGNSGIVDITGLNPDFVPGTSGMVSTDMNAAIIEAFNNSGTDDQDATEVSMNPAFAIGSTSPTTVQDAITALLANGNGVISEFNNNGIWRAGNLSLEDNTVIDLDGSDFTFSDDIPRLIIKDTNSSALSGQGYLLFTGFDDAPRGYYGFTSNGNNNIEVWNRTADGYINFRTGGTGVRGRILDNGNWLIGASTALNDELLNVQGDVKIATGRSLHLGNASDVNHIRSNSGGTGIEMIANSIAALSLNAAGDVRVFNKLGVGITAPSFNLDVGSSSAGIIARLTHNAHSFLTLIETESDGVTARQDHVVLQSSTGSNVGTLELSGASIMLDNYGNGSITPTTLAGFTASGYQFVIGADDRLAVSNDPADFLNIYGSDGTLPEDRIITMDGNTLTLEGITPTLRFKDSNSNAAAGQGSIQFIGSDDAVRGYYGYLGGNNNLSIWNRTTGSTQFRNGTAINATINSAGQWQIGLGSTANLNEALVVSGDAKILASNPLHFGNASDVNYIKASSTQTGLEFFSNAVPVLTLTSSQSLRSVAYGQGNRTPIDISLPYSGLINGYTNDGTHAELAADDGDHNPTEISNSGTGTTTPVVGAFIRFKNSIYYSATIAYSSTTAGNHAVEIDLPVLTDADGNAITPNSGHLTIGTSGANYVSGRGGVNGAGNAELFFNMPTGISNITYTGMIKYN